MALRGRFKRFFNPFREEEDIFKEEQRCRIYLDHSKKIKEALLTKNALMKFNHSQCSYLLHTLMEAVDRAKKVQFSVGSVEIMKLLWRIAEEVKSVFASCCRKDWVLAAIVLGNMSEHVIQLTADLDLCILLMRDYQVSKAFYPKEEYESRCSTSYEKIKARVAEDLSTLLTKLDTLKGSSIAKKPESLRSRLVQPLLVQPFRSRLAQPLLVQSLCSRLAQHSSGSVQASAWEIQYSNLEQVMKLGVGSFGIVWRSKWLGEEVAEKMFQGSNPSSFENEVKILTGLAHPNIVPLLGYAVDGNKCCIIMELMDGDLLSLIQERSRKNPTLRHNRTFKVPFSDFETVDMMLEAAKGMLYLHDHKVVHRDLKSSNILVKRRKDNDVEFVYLKVADFGLSKTKESSSSPTNLTLNIGTTRWMAPELMPEGEDDLARTSDHESQPSYPFKVDVYSFGMVCYEICTGDLPFSSISHPKEVRKMVLEGMSKDLETLEDLNMANEIKPLDGFTLRNQGAVLKTMGNDSEALEDLNMANEIQSSNAFTLRNRGDVFRMMSTYSEALDDLNMANEIEPRDAFTLRIRGAVLRMMGKYSEALDDLNMANEIEPRDAFTLAVRGAVLRMMGKYSEALEDLNMANEIEPRDAFTLSNRGDVLRMMSKYSEALEDLNMANEIQPNNAFTLTIRGAALAVMGKYSEALDDLNMANEIEPRDSFTLRIRGALLRMMGKYSEALDDLNMANEIEPLNALTLEYRGDALVIMGKYSEALDDLNMANEIKPRNARTLTIRGAVLKMMGKYSEALEDLNMANEIEPRDALTLWNRGDVLRKMNKYSEALDDLNMANEIEPRNALFLNIRGDVLRMMGKYSEALEDLNMANEIECRDALKFKSRGDVF